MRRSRLGPPLLLALSATTVPALAAAGESKLRFCINFVSPTGDYSEPGDMSLEADDAIGPEVGFEYRFSDLMGVDFNLGYYEHDLEASDSGLSATVGDVSQIPLTVGLNFHLLKESKIDFYLGPTLGYVMWDDVKLDAIVGGGEVSTKDGVSYGLNLGVDIPLNPKWDLVVGGRYTFSSVETDEGSDDIELDVDPIEIRLGFGVRF